MSTTSIKTYSPTNSTLDLSSTPPTLDTSISFDDMSFFTSKEDSDSSSTIKNESEASSTTKNESDSSLSTKEEIHSSSPTKNVAAELLVAKAYIASLETSLSSNDKSSSTEESAASSPTTTKNAAAELDAANAHIAALEAQLAFRSRVDTLAQQAQTIAGPRVALDALPSTPETLAPSLASVDSSSTSQEKDRLAIETLRATEGSILATLTHLQAAESRIAMAEAERDSLRKRNANLQQAYIESVGDESILQLEVIKSDELLRSMTAKKLELEAMFLKLEAKHAKLEEKYTALCDAKPKRHATIVALFKRRKVAAETVPAAPTFPTYPTMVTSTTTATITLSNSGTDFSEDGYMTALEGYATDDVTIGSIAPPPSPLGFLDPDWPLEPNARCHKRKWSTLRRCTKGLKRVIYVPARVPLN
ncbi:hypothetical protein CC85DRAFT_285887 [Cutaneotrichosporon oleaginosum]|uniref:Uncharacterized protein n=1 Tax=Cutaneotrichosporon oleaginosum TaxID=879819 RepID=A0A0J0XLY8_9TREE|nr:uncharacterized protein CC85DRAFT_285887 [Cutaneotrichosporon oleaginosum]KLT42122.1 hypothetical protein CC85DRAFT_285887 [Cutaneotrichosporon oleaginosum]TXT04639.1 hypothetical protein COLE_07458 [Cutaneotrichosporon oleaginosum]